MTVKAQELLKDKLRAKNVLRYILLPNIVPQIKELAGSGFGYFAFLIATVYNAVRILPANHPYLNPNNIGKFGLREVIAAAANNIKVSRNNWDQILIFIAILAGILLLILQFLALIFMIFNGQAFAAGASGLAPFTGMFATTDPEKDIAFMLLDHTFGIPGFFGSEVLQSTVSTSSGTETVANPTPFHLALHKLFHFYNLAILVVAVLVFIYYVVVVVAETAQTGTPFGKRFAHIYAPIRLVIAIGLLVPLAHGFNSAQYITLYAAKIGSGFATNGWLLFNQNLENPSGATNAELIGYPAAPDPEALISAMAVIQACREAYLIQENIVIEPYIDVGSSYLKFSAGIYSVAKTNSEDGNIEIIFGEFIPGSHHPGTDSVRPYCGSVIVPSYIDSSVTDAGAGAGGALDLQERYYKIVENLWNSPTIKFISKRIAYAHSSLPFPSPTGKTYSELVCEQVVDPGAATPPPGGPGGAPGSVTSPTGDACTASSYKPPSNYKAFIISDYEGILEFNIKTFIDKQRTIATFELTDDIKERGWGGAGIWYSKIAEINGAYTVAAANFPKTNAWPLVLQDVLEQKQSAQANTLPCKLFEPNLPDEAGELTLTPRETYYATVMDETYQYWSCGHARLTSNVIWDAISAVFGTDGLFDIREASSSEITNPDGTTTTKVSVHPLTQLTLVGKSLVESAIRSMMWAMVGSVAGGANAILAPFDVSAQAASGFFVSIATVGLSMGFMLFYILPFLPFIYFFFAVGAWVKSIFEAMCAAPLWAIAHLRIDGEGIPGKSAMNGYFLIFEIFLRPILTVFGLVAGMGIFIALAIMLNELFDIVVINVTGNDLSAPGLETEEFGLHLVDQFFFTIVYTVILYMMAISSFKMINLVPNNILRWLGSSATAFSDNTQDPTAGLSQYAAIGGMRIGGQVAGGLTQLGSGLGSLGNAAAAGRTTGGQTG